MLKRAVERVLRALPKPPYGEARYWDQVYAETFRAQGAIEWGTPPLQMLQYQYVDGHGAVRDGTLAEHAPRDADVLVVGCGNSQLSEELATRGWDPARVVSVDFSAQSIEQAAGRARERASRDERLGALRYCVADCRSLHESFSSSSFDCAVDKGLLDALYCSSTASEAIPATVRSVLRVLRPGGRYVSLHSGGVLGLAPPAKLEEYMADARWASLETRRLLPKSDGLYLYIWTMTEANTKTTQTRSQRKVSRGRERQERG